MECHHTCLSHECYKSRLKGQTTQQKLGLPLQSKGTQTMFDKLGLVGLNLPRGGDVTLMPYVA